MITGILQWQFTRLLTNGYSHDAVGLNKILFLFLFVDTAHCRLPDRLGICGHGLWRIVVISAPDNAGVIRCKACKYRITVLSGGSRLSGNTNVVDREVGGCSGTLGHNVFHGAGKKPCRCLLKYLLGLISRSIKDNITLAVLNRGVENRTVVLASVGNGSIGAGKLKVGNTIGNSTKSKSLVIISTLKSGDTHILNILITQSGTDICKGLDRDYIHGLGNSLTNGGKALVLVVVVVDRTAVGVLVRCVILYACQSHAACIKSRSKCCNDLEGRTGLSGGSGCTVKSLACRLIAAASHKGNHVTIGLIDDCHCCLGLE